MKFMYSIPVIPNNLRHKETIIQIADALGYIDSVFDDILLRVNQRIDEREKHVAALKERITDVHKKVQKLTNTNKATQVFANSKYPANKCNEKYKSLFPIQENNSAQIKLTFNRTKVKQFSQSPNDQPSNLLQFYHVKIKYDANGFGRNSSMEGLGRCPPNAILINELLLFNTYKNLYKNYEISDPFNHNLHVNNKCIDEMNRQGPDDAPLSMTQRVGSVREAKENYFYSPDLGEVPTIDVPLDLPDLPGVADDLRYLMELGPGIAPSVQTTPVIPELPPVIYTSEIKSVDGSTVNIPSLEVSKPDMPDQLPELPIPQEEHIERDDSPSMPPDPIATQVPESCVDNSTNNHPNMYLPTTDVSAGNRASLMEAIRQAGALKKAQLHSINAEPVKSKSQGANDGNDLMADLHAKLALRRKGISGIRNADGLGEVSSAMTKVSAMIPPPLVTMVNEMLESTATEDEDGDWDE